MVGFWIIRLVQAYSPRPRDQPSDPVAIRRYVLQPDLRSVPEHPVLVARWIVLGVATALAGLIAGLPAAFLVLSVGLLALLGARLLAAQRRDRPSDRRAGLRLALILGWVAAMAGVIAIIVSFEAATGYSGIVIVVVLFAVLPIAFKLLQLMLRA